MTTTDKTTATTMKKSCPGKATPPLGNEVYAIAAASLAERGIRVTPEALANYFLLLHLPARRMVRCGLVSREQMREHMRDIDWTSVDSAETEESETEGGAAAAAVAAEAVLSDTEGDAASGDVAAVATNNVGPVSAVLRANGVELPARQLAALMHATATSPRTFVHVGLMDIKALKAVLPEEDLLNEVHFFRRAFSPGRKRHCHGRRGAYGPHHGFGFGFQHSHGPPAGPFAFPPPPPGVVHNHYYGRHGGGGGGPAACFMPPQYAWHQQHVPDTMELEGLGGESDGARRGCFRRPHGPPAFAFGGGYGYGHPGMGGGWQQHGPRGGHGGRFGGGRGGGRFGGGGCWPGCDRKPASAADDKVDGGEKA